MRLLSLESSMMLSSVPCEGLRCLHGQLDSRHSYWSENLLKWEPTNSHDVHAVAVYFEDQAVGHIPYNLAPMVSAFLRGDINKSFIYMDPRLALTKWRSSLNLYQNYESSICQYMCHSYNVIMMWINRGLYLDYGNNARHWGCDCLQKSLRTGQCQPFSVVERCPLLGGSKYTIYMARSITSAGFVHCTDRGCTLYGV